MLSLVALSFSSQKHRTDPDSPSKSQSIDRFTFNQTQHRSIMPSSKKQKDFRLHSIPKKIHRTYTEAFHRPKVEEPRAFARNKTDFKSVAWQLQKPLIAKIKGIDFTKEEKLRLLNKKSNYRDYSAILLLKKPQPCDSLRINNNSSHSQFAKSKKKNINIKQFCVTSKESQKGRYRKKYKLLNMIGNRVPLHKVGASVHLNDAPMFITVQNQ